MPAGRRGLTLSASGALAAATLALALSSPAYATPAAAPGGNGQAAPAPPGVFPGCSWPIETTPTKANLAAPDPYATYWTTPFLAGPGDSVIIRGSFPTTRFMSFVVYNDSFQDFTNTVRGKSVPSDLSDYQIAPDRGSKNPWRTSEAGKRLRFRIRILPAVSALEQRSENAIPMIDQNPPADPQGPPGVGYVIFRTYIPSGGNVSVQLPAMTVTHDGRTATLPQCNPSSSAAQQKKIANLATVLSRLKNIRAGEFSSIHSGDFSAKSTSCTSNCNPSLQYFGPSAAAKAGLFPNPVNGYLEMNFTPEKGHVVVTHGRAPSSPTDVGRGTLGDSIGAHPTPWPNTKFQVRYWSVSNYVATKPYPLVKVGQGAKVIFGGIPDYLTTLRDGYYTVVSSLPSDKPSPGSLKANAATWIPTSPRKPGAPEFQLLRNMLSQQPLYPEGFVFINPPASSSDIIPPATVQMQMGAYYPQTAQCTVQTFETQGWAGCLAASTGP
jgi:hypothetical protein